MSTAKPMSARAHYKERTPSILEEIIDDEARKSTYSRPDEMNPGAIGHGIDALLPRLGLCIDNRHPTLTGRARIRFNKSGETIEQWLPTLHGMAIRKNDRVLVQTPKDALESIVIGVVDGFETRPDIEKRQGPVLRLLSDESIKVITEAGERLIEISRGDAGPVVRLLDDAIDVELPGALRISAKSIELNAVAGDARIRASDNAVIDAEMVKLNS